MNAIGPRDVSTWLCAVAACVASASCIGAPTLDSAECVASEDCGRCARCANGACVVDLQLATCVDETEDPCDGVDNDGNGVIDDPDVCWAPVYAYDGADDTRCFSLSANGAAAACATYTATSRRPWFALFAHDTPETVRVRQCSLGQDHVLVREAPLFDALREGGPAATAAWEALGYDCSLALGWAFAAPPPSSPTTPFGPPSALARFFEPLATGGHRSGYVLGVEALPIGATCVPRDTLWVFTSSAGAGVTPTTECLRTTCPPRAQGRVEAQSPHDGALVPSGPFVASWQIRNTGDVPWPMGWGFSLLQGHWSTTWHRPLTQNVPVGGSFALTVDMVAPADGIDLVERWALFDDDGAQVVEASLRFSVPIEDAATLRSLSPPPGTRYAPGESVQIRVEIDNTGATDWTEFYALAHQSGELMTENLYYFDPVPRGGRTVVQIFTPAPGTPGRYIDSWSVRTGGARAVPIATPLGVGRTFDTVIDVVGDAEGAVLEAAIAAPITVRPSAPFTQAYWLENVGATTWERGWSLTHVSGALSRVDSVSVDRAVEPGERVLVAIPMRAPSGRPDHVIWRDGWTLQDAHGDVIGLWRPQVDGPPTYGAAHGAWLWTEVTVGEPCEAADGAR